MKFLLALLLPLALGGIASAQTLTKCFVNGGLKDEDRVYLTINGARVAGEFVIARGYDAANRETYVFGGTKTGNDLSIKFAAGKIPDALPPGRESFTWTLVTAADKESLQVPFFGRNYSTQKHEVYAGNFESCKF